MIIVCKPSEVRDKPVPLSVATYSSKLGGLDEAFGIGMFDDDDLSTAI